MNENRQFVVSGYYGCGNGGDEAVLAGIRESFAQQSENTVRLVVLSQNPEETAALHGTRSVYRMNLGTIRQVLRESDLLISGGGSLLQDTTSMRSLLYYLWVARLAGSMGVPVMLYAQGIGPLRRSLSRTLTRIVANRAAAITVRDTDSAQLLRAIGVTQPTIEVTADPAFALTPATGEPVDTLLRSAGLSLQTPFLVAALRPWGAPEEPVTVYAELLTALERRCGLPVLLLPMHPQQDTPFAEAVVRETGRPTAFPILPGAPTPELLLGLVARAQAVVAMRLHALIFAARTAVPLFALSYDPKVESLMQGLNLSDFMAPSHNFQPEAVAEKLTALLSAREVHSAALRAQAVERRRLALVNAERALALPLPGEPRSRPAFDTEAATYAE